MCHTAPHPLTSAAAGRESVPSRLPARAPLASSGRTAPGPPAYSGTRAGLLRAALLATALVALSSCAGPRCDADADCVAPAVCSVEHRCAVPGTAPDGAACERDLDCRGRACLAAGANGRCATACDGAPACGEGRCALVTDARPEGTRLRFTCGPLEGTRFAAEACAADAECRSGLCHDGRCTSPCGACPEGFACAPATLTRGAASLDHGVCSWWPVQPVLELGPVDTPASGTAALELPLPEGAGAFTLVLEDDADQVPSVQRLVAPDGTVLIGAPRAPDAGPADLARCSSAPGTATVLVPGSDDPRAAPTPGTYRLELATFEAAGYPLTPRQVAGHLERVAAVLKRPAPGGQLDLLVQVAPETGYGVADGGGTWVRALLERFEALTREKLGVTLGEVRLAALPPDAGVRVASVAQSRALWAAHSVAVPAARPINVLVVKSLAFAGGVAGGTPGAPGVYGRPASGVTVAPLTSGPAATGVLLAHEVGHFLGLFHTSDEFHGADLVTDTPSCRTPSGAGCPDERNLMFPYFPTREPLQLSAGQARVLEGSPWLYHRLHPEACGPGVDAVGLGAGGFTAGSTRGAAARLEGACGGSGGERAHLVRLDAPAGRLSARAVGRGFAPILSLRQGGCGPEAPEVACQGADGGVAALALADAGAGAWFVVVDSAGDGGAYELEVTMTP